MKAEGRLLLEKRKRIQEKEDMGIRADNREQATLHAYMKIPQRNPIFYNTL